MKEFVKYFVLGFSALLPLVNPPGSALELLGIVGVGEDKPYKLLAKKIAINIFLVIVALTGPYVLEFFGISIDILQLVGGAVLAAMGWQLLNKPDSDKQISDPNLLRAAEDRFANSWQSKVFYPFTFPLTVGPGSVTVMLTLSAQAKSLLFPGRIIAFVGLFACITLLSLLVFVFYAYAPFAAKRVPPALAHGVLRIIAFLLICIGVQIGWNGLRLMLGLSVS
jgi:multiple antibiotic resistance protein